MDRQQDFIHMMEQMYETAVGQEPTRYIEEADQRAVAAANQILDVLKGWPNVNVGSAAVARQTGLPVSYVEKIMGVAVRQGFLNPGNTPGVYSTMRTKLPISDASHIDDKGFIHLTGSGYERANFGTGGRITTSKAWDIAGRLRR